MNELGIPNLARMSLMKSYWMPQNARVTAFTAFEDLNKNQQWGRGNNTPPSLPRPIIHIRVLCPLWYSMLALICNFTERWCTSSSFDIKGTLMQIWKSANMYLFIQNQCPESFAFLILRILELFTREICKFLKK